MWRRTVEMDARHDGRFEECDGLPPHRRDAGWDVVKLSGELLVEIGVRGPLEFRLVEPTATGVKTRGCPLEQQRALGEPGNRY